MSHSIRNVLGRVPVFYSEMSGPSGVGDLTLEISFHSFSLFVSKSDFSILSGIEGIKLTGQVSVSPHPRCIGQRQQPHPLGHSFRLFFSGAFLFLGLPGGLARFHHSPVDM